MSRILLAWELGRNFGHLTRLLPLAIRLQQRGHTLLAAVRDLPTAEIVFGAEGIACTPAPRMERQHEIIETTTSYADILFNIAWADKAVLRETVEAWLAIFRTFEPELLLADHAPTALLAARIAGLRRVQIGNGFELPPRELPLPSFPGGLGAGAEAARERESVVLAAANDVCSVLGSDRLNGLKDLFDLDLSLLATFPELDHYGPRAGVAYVGPIQADLDVERVNWPEGDGARVFAYVRPEIRNVDAVLRGLALSRARVICFAPGFTPQTLSAYRNPGIQFWSQPIELAPLFATADACVCYGAAGTAIRSLLAGIPLLLFPRYAEAYIAAQRMEAYGAAVVARGSPDASAIAFLLSRLIDDPHYKARAQTFAERYRSFDPAVAADHAASAVESVLNRPGEERGSHFIDYSAIAFATRSK